jgi:hypothetical protein
MPRGAKIALAALTAGWLLLIVILSHLRPAQLSNLGPQIPIYQGAADLQEHSVSATGFRQATYKAPTTYPDKSVYYFYRREMEKAGWHEAASSPPEWKLTEGQKQTLSAAWLDQEELWRMDLRLTWAPGRPGASDEEPMVDVNCSLGRNFWPHRTPPPARSIRIIR